MVGAIAPPHLGAVRWDRSPLMAIHIIWKLPVSWVTLSHLGLTQLSLLAAANTNTLRVNTADLTGLTQLSRLAPPTRTPRPGPIASWLR